ncbi:MAG: DUF4249 domain-containing protein [Bacteroidia bacterium]|nr:DUF4249 domain-containing protein [Bacteroidia bacterium]
MNKSSLVVCTLSMILCTCTKEIEIPIPFEGKKLVLYCILSPDRPIEATLQRTFPPTGPEPDNWDVTDGTIWLYENSDLIDSLIYSPSSGTYLSSNLIKPQSDKQYKMVAEAPGFTDIYSETISLPPRTAILSVSFEDSVFNTGGSNSSGGIVRVSFEDSDQPEYYFLDSRAFFEEEPGSLTICLGGNLDAACFGAENIQCLFSDDCITNRPSNLNLGVATGFREIGGFRKADRVITHLQSLNHSLFQYLESLDQPIGIDIAFSQPTSTFTNITHGYGIFGSMIEAIDTTIIY